MPLFHSDSAERWVNYRVAWANNLMVTNRLFSDRMKKMRDRGTKIVLVDPLETETTALADLCLRIKPESDFALAFYLVRELLKRSTEDIAGNLRHASDLERLRDYAEDFDLTR